MAVSLLSLPCWAGSPVEEANPLVGTGGHGHTYPGATVPFGFVQLSPDTRNATDPWTVAGWDACSGYHYTDSTLFGFSHTHLSGTGCPTFGDVLILPLTGELSSGSDYVPLAAERFQSPFSHTNEVAQPGYYRVRLDRYDIVAELTATAHCGMHRYTFPASGQSHLLIDLVHGIGDRVTQGSLTVENDHLVTGCRFSDGWVKDRGIYFAMEFSMPFKNFGLELDGKPLPQGQSDATGDNVRGHLDYETTGGQQLVIRVGLSPTSVAEAEKNLKMEMSSWNFDAMREGARKVWDENLSRIRVESADPNIRQTFYSAMYHVMTAPTLYNNADNSYFGPDKQVHDGSGFQNYSTMSLWDTFRAENPLLTLVQPARVNDIVQSVLAFYQESPDHALPMWPLAGRDTECMIAYHAVPVIYDAYKKGFHGFDPQLAYQAMTNTALSSRNRQDEYQKYGYVPWVKGRTEATSRTLEFAYDDWCIAQMAGDLGMKSDAELFTQRAQNYRNVWDSNTQFFRSKNPDGSFREPFDPKEVASDNTLAAEDFTEANAWQYAFAVMQDVPGMIRLFGGNQSFINKLDQLFNEDSDMPDWRIDVSGIVGQYAQGNEPCQHVAYLYALAGAQYKTAQRVHQIMVSQYENVPDGLCGNDDCGQMSAWYVFSAIGLYPVNPASGIYVIGSPAVEKAVIELDPQFYPGRTFTILAHNVSNQNIYIKSARLNGVLLERPWLTHQEITAGGTLELEMDILPSKIWNAPAGRALNASN